MRITLLFILLASLCAQTPDDSPAARESALARLRSDPPRTVCASTTPARMSRSFGSPCASREFPAPPILSAPKFTWTVKPGWWGVWSPFLAGDLVLTGSCNNDDNAGLSAFDTNTGKLRWRIGEVCSVGQRRGTMGTASFYELPSGEVLWIYGRDNGEPADYYVVDPKAGRIVRSLTPIKRGPFRPYGTGFAVLTQSAKEQTSYLNALTPEFDRLVWRNDGFRSSCTDKLDSHCKPVFSAAAVSGNMMFITATAKDQPEPPTRQLHAIDLTTGRTLWRHTQQPVVERTHRGSTPLDYRSDDDIPMVAGGRVIIQVDGLPGKALRALEPATGRILWTTPPSPRNTGAYIAAGDTLIVESEPDGNARRELLAYRLADATIAWRRPVSDSARLLASSGGVFYVSDRIGKEDFRFEGFDGLTGTLLWTTVLPGHNLPFDHQWSIRDTRPSSLQGPSWRIAQDGAIYGVTLQGVYKLGPALRP